MKRAFAIIVTVALGMGSLPLSAQVYSLLHSFTNTDGAQPYAGLIASGNTLFCTTKFGGSTGNGAVFSVNTDGTGFTVLHSFTGADGADITADLFLGSNMLYGAAYQGGDGNQQGTLFSLAEDGSGFTNIHVFAGAPDGDDPKAGLILSGNTLYGTASSGTGGCVDGTVFSVETNGANFTPLHIFSGADGMEPEGDLVLGGNVLYGTTYNGGASNLGVIFSIQTNGSKFTVLHSFSNTDGTLPAAGLVLSGGTLYGTASAGGEYNAGTVFSIKTNGANFTVLYNFIHTIASASTDGYTPLAALMLSKKVLYGTTSQGGTTGQGTVFSISTDGTNYTQLLSFGGNYPSEDPAAPVVLVGNSLFGTTVDGGADQNGSLFAIQIRGVAFTSEPSPQTGVAVGADVFFGTGAFSLTVPTATVQYQWRLNGVNIPGATTQSLSFSDVQPTNGGSVTMTISDGTDAETSVPAGFSVSIQTSASGNDNFGNRFLLGEAPNGIISSSNVSATRQPGEPEILPGNPGGKSIWFRWQPSASGTAVFSTTGSDFDTIMGVYTGSTLNTLKRVPSAINDDDYGGYLTSRVSFNCSAGTEYDIVVDGYRGASGNVVLSWVTEKFAAALPSVFQAPVRQTIASNGAAVTLVCQPNSGVPSWLFNGQPTGVTGTNFVINPVSDTNVGTYVAQVTTGGGVATTEPAYLQINTLEDGTTDSNSMAWNKFLDSAGAPYSNPPQPLIRKQDGGDTRGYSVAQTFSTVGAAGEPGEPSIDGQIGGAPVWFTYVTPTNGAMLIDTTGSSFNTLLGVFIGPGNSFATLTGIGAGYTTNRLLNGQPQVFIPDAPRGQTNYIVVDGYHGASGTVHLSINLGDPVVIGAPPQDQFVLAGSNATFTVGATGSTPLSYLWQFNGTNIARATNAILTVSNVQSVNLGLYTVVVGNLVSAASNSAMLSLGSVPAISIQPLSQTVAAGGTANLSVTASGTPPPDFQWMFNGSSIGTNGSALSIPDFQATNQGSYSVLVSNSVGAVASSNALVQLNTLLLGAPSINSGVLQLQLTGAAGGNYSIEASFNLLTWTPLATNIATNGFLLFSDPDAGVFKRRFYRGVTN